VQAPIGKGGEGYWIRFTIGDRLEHTSCTDS
jgi:hypothetical protein